jgi:HK97 family phage major capsid protein
MLQALREQRDAKAKALRDLVNKPIWNPTEDQPAYDALLAEIDDLDGKISRINKANELAASTSLSNTIIDAADRHARDENSAACALFAKWLRGGDRAISDADWPTLRNTMSTTTNSEGGYTVATDVATQVLDALKKFGGMRAVAEVLRTAQGNPMNFPTSDGTSEEGEIVDQNASASDLDIAFGVIALVVYKYSSKVVTVPIELIQDSSVDIVSFVVQRLATRLGRITNKHFTIGTGTNQPTGIVTAAGAGKVGTTGQTATVTYDDLVDLQHSVDPAYREMGNAGFMMADLTLRMVRKIKDTQGRPIFVPGYETGTPGGAPDRLLGSAININQHMPVPAANAKSILFGAMDHYKIRDAMEIEVQRFTDSAYAKKGQVGFLAWLRSGGNLTDVGGAVKYYQHPAT